VSSRDGEELESDLLAARERDLKPLLEESTESLGLEGEQIEAMEDFLDLAWCSGTRTGREQVEAKMTRQKTGGDQIPVARLEKEFKAMMDDSAAALNLSVGATVDMWNFLHEAWLAGQRSCETELLAMFIEMQSDVSAEAQEWLDGRDRKEDR
jgi:hypothetical protein